MPQIYTTFVSSHNVCELNPIFESRPEAILAREAANFESVKKDRLKHPDPSSTSSRQSRQARLLPKAHHPAN